MSLIQGIGDEVVWALIGLVTIAVVSLAWLSTQVEDVGTLVSVVVIDRERLLTRIRNLRGLVAPTRAETRDQARQEYVTRMMNAQSSDSRESVDGSVGGEGRSDMSQSSVPVNTGENIELVNPGASQNMVPDTSPDLATNCATNEVPDIGDSLSAAQARTKEREGDKINGNTVTSSKDSTDINNVKTCNQNSRSNSATNSCPPSADTCPSQNCDNQAKTNLGPSPSVDISNGVSVDSQGLKIKLQFIDGQQRTVESTANTTIGEFKRLHFAQQLSERYSVRLIVNGQELRDESQTLCYYSVTSNSVIHCLVTRAPDPEPSSTPTLAQSGFDIGMLMFPMCGLLLTLFWYLRICYRGLFNATSTFSLIAITFLFVIALLASTRNTAGGRSLAGERPHID